MQVDKTKAALRERIRTVLGHCESGTDKISKIGNVPSLKLACLQPHFSTATVLNVSVLREAATTTFLVC